MKEALSSSKTPVLTWVTRRNIPEVTILHTLTYTRVGFGCDNRAFKINKTNFWEMVTDELPSDYTTSYPRTEQSSQSPKWDPQIQHNLNLHHWGTVSLIVHK
jgi:hypothetical protein